MNPPLEILLVEDNPQEAELTIHALKKRTLAKHFVHVHDGQEALDFLFAKGRYEHRDIRELPKVVLLDWKLPKLDGVEVLRQLRANKHTRLVPVVVLTSSREERDVIEAYQLGANSYIVKPVDFEKFLEVVSNMITYWLLLNELPNLQS
jgi:two-component system, response regulator